MKTVNENIDGSEIANLVEAVKQEPAPIHQGTYDLQQFANALYFKLKNTNGFSSSDIAKYLLNNSRKLDVAFVNAPA